MQVTVGVPVYNGAAYLDGALAALSAQGCKDMAIVISDNASTDETPAIIAKWAARDPRISVMRHKENVGAFLNFEGLLRGAKTPWFMFAAYDDLWSPQYVETLLAAAQSRPGLRMAAPRVINIDNTGREIRTNAFPEGLEGLDRIARVRALLKAGRGGWFYGLYDTRSLMTSWDETFRAFTHPWAFDILLFLPFLLADATAGDNAAVFYQRETGISEERYRPKTPGGQFVLSRDFIARCVKCLAESPLSAAEKAALFPAVLRYAKHGGKLRRVLKLALARKAA